MAEGRRRAATTSGTAGRTPRAERGFQGWTTETPWTVRVCDLTLELAPLSDVRGGTSTGVGMRLRVIAPIVICGVAASAAAQTGAPRDRWVDSLFAPYNKPGSPGCAVGVVQKGALTYARGYGE